MSIKGNWSYFDNLEVITTQKCSNRFENDAKKMIFDHFFDHNFWSIMEFWVKFISLESRYLGLQFEYKFCLIWTYIEWVMIVWSQVNPTGKIRVSKEACVRTLCSKTLKLQFLGHKASLFDGPRLLDLLECPKHSKWI